MSGNSYAPKVPMTDDEIQRWKPVCADFVSFRAGVRAAERAYNVGDLVRQANHYMDEWSNVCNENQRLLNIISVQVSAMNDALDAMALLEPASLESLSAKRAAQNNLKAAIDAATITRKPKGEA